MAKTAPYNKLAPLGEMVNSRPDLALEPLQDLARLYPSDPQVLYALGVAYLNTGQHYEAAGQFEQALKRDKQNQQTLHEALARAYAGAGMPAHAYRAASRAGMTQKPWQEEIYDGIPEGAKMADLLEFEQARAASMRGKSGDSIKQMRAFIKKFPDYLPAHNVLATAFYIQGQFDEARTEIEKVLEADPRNIHALLNLARVERLTKGVAAVKALRSRVEAARIESESEKIVAGGPIALANLYQIMEDKEAADRVITAYLAANEEEEDSAEVSQILDRIERSNRTPATPQQLPSELLPPGWSARWSQAARQGNKQVEATIFGDLQKIPGWFEKIEERLLYEENQGLAQLFTTFLLNPGRTLPSGRSADDYAGRLIKRLEEGKGRLDNILAVTTVLKSAGLLPEGAVVRGPDGEPLQHMELELTSEPIDGLENSADLRLYEQALNDRRAGRYAVAQSKLEKLRDKYPDHVSLQFNIASVMASQGHEEQAFAMMEDIWQKYPHYLFAPAQLAVKALQEGDLARAREYLKFPEGLKRLHVQEYGFFMAARVGLALREDDTETARKFIPMLTQLLDEDDSSFQFLHQEMMQHMQRGGRDAVELFELLM